MAWKSSIVDGLEDLEPGQLGGTVLELLAPDLALEEQLGPRWDHQQNQQTEGEKHRGQESMQPHRKPP